MHNRRLRFNRNRALRVVVSCLAIGVALTRDLVSPSSAAPDTDKRPKISVPVVPTSPDTKPQKEFTYTFSDPPPFVSNIPFPAIKDWRTLRIALQRGPCMGTCPAYAVTISGDGTVDYRGFECVFAKGQRKGQVAEDSVRRLVEKFRQARFFALRNNFVAEITDNPAYKLSIRFDGRAKTVGDYVGRMVGMPHEVKELEDEVDKVAGTEKWIGDSMVTCSWSHPKPFPAPGLKLLSPERR